MKIGSVIISIIQKELNFLVGVAFIPLSYLGLIFATNSLDAGHMENPDGLFITAPYGIAILIPLLLWLVFTVIRMITKKFKVFEPIFFGIGLLAYGAYWLISSMLR